jgi:LPXTG-motif cell wall-anchored protein
VTVTPIATGTVPGDTTTGSATPAGTATSTGNQTGGTPTGDQFPWLSLLAILLLLGLVLGGFVLYRRSQNGDGQ